MALVYLSNTGEGDMYTKEIVTITVSKNGWIHTREVDLDNWLDRTLIISYRREGYKVKINRYLTN
jgi:lipocalin